MEFNVLELIKNYLRMEKICQFKSTSRTLLQNNSKIIQENFRSLKEPLHLNNHNADDRDTSARVAFTFSF